MAVSIAMPAVVMDWTAKYAEPAFRIVNPKCKRKSLNRRSQTSADGHPLVSELHRLIGQSDKERPVVSPPF